MEQEEEELLDIDMDAPLAEAFKMRKLQTRRSKKKKSPEVAAAHGGERLQASAAAAEDYGDAPPGITVSLFDYSVENHFKAVDTISKLCGEPETPDFDPAEINRLSSSITFLREWRYFNYKPRTIRFACQKESINEKDVIGEISLPQFSAAAVPKKEAQNGNAVSAHNKDFVLYVGGPVWALDWCPRVHQQSGCNMKTEFVAVAAHPPESSYHKIGAPLTGRGVIQIWSLLNIDTEEYLHSQVQKKQKQNSGEGKTNNPKSTKPQKPRGRPRKKPLNESLDNVDSGTQIVQALGIQYPEDSLLSVDVASNGNHEHVAEEDLPSKVAKMQKQDPGKCETDNAKSTKPKRPKGRPRKNRVNESLDNVDSDTQIIQALGIQYPEDSSYLLSVDVASIDNHEHIAEIGSKEDLPSEVAKKQKQESGKCKRDNANSTKPKRPRGRPRKNRVNESLDNADSGRRYVLEHVAPTNSGTEQDICIQIVAGDKLLLTASEHSRLKDKARTKGQTHGTGMNLLTQDENKDCPSMNPQTSAEPQRPRGRRRKKPVKSLDYIDSSSQCAQALAIDYPEDSFPLPSLGVTNQRLAEDKVPSTASKHERLKDEARIRDQPHPDGLPIEAQDENKESTSVNSETFASCDPDSIRSSENITSTCYGDTNTLRNSIPKDVALPRMMLCLAHNGKVAWDVKWQPSNSHNKHRMGYLAVVLGNGALEVWEVPFPRTVEVIYPACQLEGTDPRFMKLEPVFRCSKLKCGDRQSIPLTVEWSASSPHDMILAGCHDGVVALWKFSAAGSCKDTKPLLCFSADTVPIRALAWAPAESDSEGANVIVTAGHKGMKFWDIRDPFRPLWDFNPVQRVIYSLDWLPDPRCVIVSLDDGTLRTLSLLKAAYDVPVTGKPFVGTQQQGFPSYLCSSFTIWSVHVSRHTGMVAYCGADGNALRFQLTTRAVERDPFRNRAPHFLCGSLTEEESALMVITPESDTPFPMKKSMNEWGDAPRTKRGFLSVSNQKKRAKEHTAKNQTSVEQPLALCYGNDPGTEYDSDPSIAQKSKEAHKSKIATKGKSKTDKKALICRDEDVETFQNEAEEESEVVDEIESFPPKIVAIHRVRWNMNKGSEKWLSYGGAAGVVRCQEIDISIC